MLGHAGSDNMLSMGLMEFHRFARQCNITDPKCVMLAHARALLSVCVRVHVDVSTCVCLRKYLCSLSSTASAKAASHKTCFPPDILY